MPSPLPPSSRSIRAVTLIEVIITVVIVAISFLATFGLVQHSRRQNALERERARAHTLAMEWMEEMRATAFPDLQARSESVTITDAGTPDDTSDDTIGERVLILRDSSGTVLSQAPQEADLLTVELAVRWTPRWSTRTNVRNETLVTQVAP